MKRVKTLLTKGALLALGLVSFTGGVHGEVTDRSLMLAAGAPVSGREHQIYDGITANVYASVDTTTGNGNTNDVAWAPCGNVYAAAHTLSSSSEVFVYEVLDTGPVLRDDFGSDSAFQAVGWSYDNQYLATGSATSPGGPELIVFKYNNRYNQASVA